MNVPLQCTSTVPPLALAFSMNAVDLTSALHNSRYTPWKDPNEILVLVVFNLQSHVNELSRETRSDQVDLFGVANAEAVISVVFGQ